MAHWSICRVSPDTVKAELLKLMVSSKMWSQPWNKLCIRDEVLVDPDVVAAHERWLFWSRVAVPYSRIYKQKWRVDHPREYGTLIFFILGDTCSVISCVILCDGWRHTSFLPSRTLTQTTLVFACLTSGYPPRWLHCHVPCAFLVDLSILALRVM